MRTSKKIVSLVLAVLMVASMMVIGTVVASATSKADLQAVFANGGTVVLDSDVNVGNGLTVGAGKTVVLDLAGYTITSSRYAFYNSTNGNLTINDSVGTGKVNATEACVCTLKGVTGSTTTINGGTYTTVDNGVFMGNGTGNPASGNNTWNINDGTFNGNIQSAGYIAMGIYAPNDDVWNVNGGTFNITNGCGICQRAGVVNVADGVVFNVTGDGHKGHTGDSHIVVTSGAGIVYDSQSAYPAQDASAKTNVTGGTFNTEQAAVEQVKADGDATRVEVTGGSFSQELDDTFVAPAANAVTANGKTYVGKNVITNATELYDACWAGDGNYVIGNDIALNDWYFYPVMGNLTIDGNGKTLTATTNIQTNEVFRWYTNQNACLTLSNITLDGANIAETAVYTKADPLTPAQQNDNANCKVTMTNCTVKNFVGFDYVGAVYLFSHSKGEFNNCTFTGNSTPILDEDGMHGADIWGGAATTNTINGGSYSDSVFVNGGNASLAVQGDADVASVEVCAPIAQAGNYVTVANTATVGKTVGQYTKIEGYQNSVDNDAVRIYTRVDQNFLADCSEYGYVVAAYSGNKDNKTLDFSNLVTGNGNGQKTINCKDTTNVGVGFGDGYVTLKVTGMSSNNKVVARFYYVKEGVTYYSTYSSYDGILAKRA